MEQWKEDAPKVDLAAFPIVAKPVKVSDEGDHEVRENAVSSAVHAALGLPKAVRLSSWGNGASMNMCGAGGPKPTTYRVRINGFGFGTGSKKDIEYLSISVLGIRDDIVV